MKRGMIYWINLSDAHPPELGKMRPGLIVSNSVQNNLLPTVVIIPISSRPHAIWPLRLEFKMPSGKNSYLVIPGIRQVSTERLGDTIGELPNSLLEKVGEALTLYLSD